MQRADVDKYCAAALTRSTRRVGLSIFRMAFSALIPVARLVGVI